MAEYNPSKIIKDGNTYNFRDTTKIPLAGSNAISGSLIPSTDGTVDLGSPSYQWNNAYIKSLTINGVACGDILTHNESEFVDVSSSQTIGGQKIFASNIGVQRDIYSFASSPYGKNTPPANTSYQYVFFSGNTASQGFTNIWYGGFIELATNTDGSARGSWVIRNTSDNRMGIQLSESADGSSSSIIPLAAAIDLGTSTNKWKSFNGVNPGALSLPSDAYIDIDTTNYAWGSNFTFTPDYDGYCFLSVGSSTNSRVISLKSSRGEYYFSNQNNIFRFTFPVYKGKLVTILIASSGTESVIPTIRVFSCQGNV